jgi:hypothetical protein
VSEGSTQSIQSQVCAGDKRNGHTLEGGLPYL